MYHIIIATRASLKPIKKIMSTPNKQEAEAKLSELRKSRDAALGCYKTKQNTESLFLVKQDSTEDWLRLYGSLLMEAKADLRKAEIQSHKYNVDAYVESLKETINKYTHKIEALHAGNN